MRETERGKCCQPSEYEIRDDDQDEEARSGGCDCPREVVVTEGIARVKENQQVSYRKAERTHPCEWYAGNSCHDNNFVEPKNLSYPVP